MKHDRAFDELANAIIESDKHLMSVYPNIKALPDTIKKTVERERASKVEKVNLELAKERS